jgi:hypothetical protein
LERAIWLRLKRRFGRIGLSVGEGERKRRATAQGSVRPYPSAMPVHDALHDRQAHPGPFIVLGAMQALKDTEQFVGVFHVESRAIVLDEVHHLAIYP